MKIRSRQRLDALTTWRSLHRAMIPPALINPSQNGSLRPRSAWCSQERRLQEGSASACSACPPGCIYSGDAPSPSPCGWSSIGHHQRWNNREPTLVGQKSAWPASVKLFFRPQPNQFAHCSGQYAGSPQIVMTAPKSMDEYHLTASSCGINSYQELWGTGFPGNFNKGNILVRVQGSKWGVGD